MMTCEECIQFLADNWGTASFDPVLRMWEVEAHVGPVGYKWGQIVDNRGDELLVFRDLVTSMRDCLEATKGGSPPSVVHCERKEEGSLHPAAVNVSGTLVELPFDRYVAQNPPEILGEKPNR